MRNESLTRRRVLATGLGALGSALLPGCRNSADSNASDCPCHSGFIDAHCHVWSPDISHFPLGPWANPSQMKPASFTAEQLLEIVRRNNVGRVVLVQHAPYFGYDSSYLIDCARRYPGVFSIIGMIDERLPELSARLQRLAGQGVRGVRVSPTIHADRTLVKDPATWHKSPGMQSLWKLAVQERIAICPILSPELLPTLDSMCAQFPETCCVIDHFGHVAMDKEAQIRDLLRLSRHPNVCIKVSAFYKMGDKKAPYHRLLPLIKRLVDAYGPRRLMWGSDCPYQLESGNNYPDALALIRDGHSLLSESERLSILGATAERIFFRA